MSILYFQGSSLPVCLSVRLFIDLSNFLGVLIPLRKKKMAAAAAGSAFEALSDDILVPRCIRHLFISLHVYKALIDYICLSVCLSECVSVRVSPRGKDISCAQHFQFDWRGG